MWGGLCFKCSLKSFIFVYVESLSLGAKLHPAPSKYSECKWGLGVERGKGIEQERELPSQRICEVESKEERAKECIKTICNERKGGKRCKKREVRNKDVLTVAV